MGHGPVMTTPAQSPPPKQNEDRQYQGDLGPPGFVMSGLLDNGWTQAVAIFL